MEAIRVEHLSKSYGAGNTEVRALEDVSLWVARGEMAALLGPSGSGKSTLLMAIGLLSLPARGRILLEGRLLAEGGRALTDLAAIRRRSIGFIFQRSNLVPFLTAAENVRLALGLSDITGATARRRAQELLDHLGVGARRPLPLSFAREGGLTGSRSASARRA